MAYAQSRRWSPGGLAAAVGINAAVLAALATANPEVIASLPIPPLTIYTVPEPIPPEPLPQPQPKPQREARAAIARPDPKPAPIDPVIDLGRGPEISFGTGPNITLDPVPPGAGAGVGAGPAEPPAPPPLIGATRDPRHVDAFQPGYPAAKLRLEEEGRVQVRVLVGTDGRVKAVEPIGSPDPAFFAATRKQALARWRFRPATRGGEPVEQWLTQSVTFTLTR